MLSELACSSLLELYVFYKVNVNQIIGFGHELTVLVKLSTQILPVLQKGQESLAQ